MAAGLGFKDFITGEVLTAADVDGYLMQGVWVFASAAARDAAVTAPQEGNFAYLKDTNVTTYYTGSAWANLDTTGMTNPMTTTGDTIYSSSGSTPARLGIGTTGQVLTVASGLPSWSTPTATGGMTLISTTTLTGASVTISSIPSSYVNLFLVIRQFLPATDSGKLNMRLNADSASRYRVITGTGDTAAATFNGTEMNISNSVDNATTQFSGSVLLADYANTTTWKVADIFATGNDATTTTSLTARWTKNVYNQTGAISSIQFLADTGNMTSGSVLLYGVK